MKTLLDQPTKLSATNGATRETNGKCHHLADAPVERNGHGERLLGVRYFESPSVSLKVKVLDETARPVAQKNGHVQTQAVLICPERRDAVAALAETAPLANTPILGQSLIECWLVHLAMRGVK